VTAFDEATAVTALGGGAYAATPDPDWSAPNGPNGGYLAAIVLRAMAGALDDPSRPARSITLHYLRPPQPAGVRIDVVVERSGRTLSTLTARLSQDDRLCVIAVGAFAGAFPPSPARFAAAMPQVPPAREVEPYPAHADLPPIARRLVLRGAIGAPPFSAADEALTGGWMSLHEPHPVDAPLLALYADGWLPAAFTVLSAPAFAPTVDLTIHFRSPGAAAALSPGEPLLGVFRSRWSADGLIDEDGELWSPDGVLLAHSRQLALLAPLGDR
jgi:acyl-CoA thioesterase